MDDVQFMALAEDTVRYIDEKYGRKAAWAAAIAVVVFVVALVFGLIVWFTS